MKAGDKVKLVDVTGIEGYEIMKQLKRNKIYTVERIKNTGGVILKGINHPMNIFGHIQGIQQNRFKKVKAK